MQCGDRVYIQVDHLVHVTILTDQQECCASDQFVHCDLDRQLVM